MNNIIALYIFFIGLCFGSFLNVFILRGLSGENFIISRSKCPKCNNQLKWYMNIPLLSYIFLRGKCAYCKEKISIQYPIIEFITGCSFVIAFLSFGLTFKTLFICLFFFLFIALSTTDILETVIIDYHAYILFGLALIYALFNTGDVTILQAIIGGIAGFLFFEILSRIGCLFIKFRIFGEGDSLIALGLGAIFGVKNFLIIACLSILIQSLLAIPFLIYKTARKKDFSLMFSYIIILLGFCAVYYVNFYKNINEGIGYIVYLILMVTALLWSLKNILASVKNKDKLNFDEAKEKFSLLPFGPAMIIAGTLGIFYLEQIKIVIKSFLY